MSFICTPSCFPSVLLHLSVSLPVFVSRWCALRSDGSVPFPPSPRDSPAPRCHCVESVQKEPTHPIFPLAWMQRERERKRMCFVREFPWLLAWEGDVIDAHSSPLLQCFHKLEEPMCSHMTRRKTASISVPLQDTPTSQQVFLTCVPLSFNHSQFLNI